MKLTNLKTFTVVLFAFMLSACASMHGTATVYPVGDQSQRIDPINSNPLPVAVEQAELKTPEAIPDDNAIPAPNPQSKLLSERARVVMSDAEIKCMAQVIYFEARGEGTSGQVGVGYVVLNRMGSDKFTPTTACGIVHERNRRGCQFSWTCDGIADRIRNLQVYERARQVAISVLTREAHNPVGNSLYFRHKSVKCKYAAHQRLVASIGHHNFFAALQ